MIGEDYPAEAYYKLLADNRKMQAALKTAMDMAEAIRKRHAKLVEAAEAVVNRINNPPVCGIGCDDDIDSVADLLDQLESALDDENDSRKK